jgi:hypothetical protein
MANVEIEIENFKKIIGDEMNGQFVFIAKVDDQRELFVAETRNGKLNFLEHRKGNDVNDLVIIEENFNILMDLTTEDMQTYQDVGFKFYEALGVEHPRF